MTVFGREIIPDVRPSICFIYFYVGIIPEGSTEPPEQSLHRKYHVSDLKCWIDASLDLIDDVFGREMIPHVCAPEHALLTN